MSTAPRNDVPLTNPELVQLAAEYEAALAGGSIADAMRLHTASADINTRHISWKGTDADLALRLFRAAMAQGKLLILADVVRAEGFVLPTLDNLLSRVLPQPASDDTQHEVVLESEDYYREHVATQTRYIDIRGIGNGPAKAFPILELYTQLYVQVGLSNFDLQRGRLASHSRRTLEDALDGERCLLVTGDAGSGKTTFLRKLAHSKLAEDVAHLPILINLSDIWDLTQAQGLILEPEALLDYCDALCRKEGLGLSRGYFANLAADGKCIWLLDSLDELPSADAREEVVGLVQAAANRWSKCPFVMTSRPLPLMSRAVPLGFTHCVIDKWRELDLRTFLEAWTSLLHPHSTEASRRREWGLLLSAILSSQDLRSLATNAVMVTAMAVVHHNQQRLPGGRGDLLEALLFWLLRAKHRVSETKADYPKFVEQRHQEIALALFESESGRRRRFGRLWAARLIARHFATSNTVDEDAVESALDFLAREETETGLLVRRGDGDLEFWHLSFQEYLAAKAIAGKTDDAETGWWAILRPHLSEIEWREVLLFVPACLYRLGGERVDLFIRRLARSCTSSDLIGTARLVALGGCVLKDMQPAGYSADNVPEWREVLEMVRPVIDGSLSVAVPVETRYEVAVAYGVGGDERLRDFDATWRSFPASRWIMGAQSSDPRSANYDPDAAPWEGPTREVHVAGFDVRCFPITVMEFSAFVDDYGYSVPVWWTESGAAEWLSAAGVSAPLDWEEQQAAPSAPVTGVSWYEACAYCSWLTECDPRPYVYMLPSESQWEYAARSGSEAGKRFPWGNVITMDENVEANVAWSGLRKKTPYGMFPKCTTGAGLLDMFGNVEEWCADAWTPDHTLRPLDGSAFVDHAIRYRTVRGGSAIRFLRLCRPTYRSRIFRDMRYHPVGFRPVRMCLGQTVESAEAGL